ncbi:MAG TPA: OmpA family protein [Syntrophorhabdaceae bacterium]|nr:OmpA family protein [Syntrophorhabdaceae bacterium]
MKHVFILIVVGIFVLAGCAPKVVQQTQPVAPTVVERPLAVEDSGAKMKKEGISEEELAEAKEEQPDRSLQAILQDIGFDFDSYAIRGSELPKIERVGTWMKREGATNLVLEGHCDERGTVEYNLALGQKRAEAVRSYLTKMGIENGRMKVVSFGKEMPLDPGHTEEAWAKNRRVHFKVDKKG